MALTTPARYLLPYRYCRRAVLGPGFAGRSAGRRGGHQFVPCCSGSRFNLAAGLSVSRTHAVPFARSTGRPTRGNSWE